jgi:hypothetical protein
MTPRLASGARSNRTRQENIMQSTSKAAHVSDTKDDSSSRTKPAGAPSDTLQSRKDREEKQKHSVSENALESSQDKNPIPPDSTRE